MARLETAARQAVYDLATRLTVPTARAGVELVAVNVIVLPDFDALVAASRSLALPNR